MEELHAATEQQLVCKINAATSVMGRTRVFKTCSDHAAPEVILDKLGWEILDIVALRQSSLTSLNIQEPESAISLWGRARTRAAKVGNGLSKGKNTHNKLLLAAKYWVEAVDPLHRYANNLHPYYIAWKDSQTSQPFFYWLDFGDGKEVKLKECPRTDLQSQCVKYLGPKEREAYEVMVDSNSGKLMYKQSCSLVDTPEGTKWIFVLSASRVLYVGEKRKGLFQHSSFVAGGAVIAAGRIVVCNGVLQAMWAYSGHYRPREDNLKELISFLEEHHVELNLVKKVPTDDDIAPAQDKPPSTMEICN